MTDNVLSSIPDPELTVTLVFFDGEEGMISTSSSDGIYGSTSLVREQILVSHILLEGFIY